MHLPTFPNSSRSRLAIVWCVGLSLFRAFQVRSTCYPITNSSHRSPRPQTEYSRRYSDRVGKEITAEPCLPPPMTVSRVQHPPLTLKPTPIRGTSISFRSMGFVGERGLEGGVRKRGFTARFVALGGFRFPQFPKICLNLRYSLVHFFLAHQIGQILHRRRATNPETIPIPEG